MNEEEKDKVVEEMLSEIRNVCLKYNKLGLTDQEVLAMTLAYIINCAVGGDAIRSVFMKAVEEMWDTTASRIAASIMAEVDAS